MINLLIKESKELCKEKENETTWFKIFKVFEKLNEEFRTREDVVENLPEITDLVIRSILSERSRLNGIALEFLKTCIKLAKGGFNFNLFMGPVIKVSGRSNKVFVNRSLEVIELLAFEIDTKCLLRHIADNIGNPNKNIRFSLYKIICLRLRLDYEVLRPYFEKGMKDPALEIRTMCKKAADIAPPQPKQEVEPKKNIVLNLTPRKNFKVDENYEEAKKVENEVPKVQRDEIVKRPIKSDFFERLNRIKKDRPVVLEKKEDELTPRRLDSYLNKYRSKSLHDLEYLIQNNSIKKCNTSASLTTVTGVQSAIALGMATAKLESQANNLSGTTNNFSNAITIGNTNHNTVSSALDKNENDSGAINLGNDQNEKIEKSDEILECNSPAGNSSELDNTRIYIETKCSTSSDHVTNDGNSAASKNPLFTSETMLYRREINSSNTIDNSVVHVLINSSIAHDQIGTDNYKSNDPFENFDDNSLIMDDQDTIDDQAISDLSKSLINISINPSRCEFSKNEYQIEDNEAIDSNHFKNNITAAAAQDPSDICHEALPETVTGEEQKNDFRCSNPEADSQENLEKPCSEPLENMSESIYQEKLGNSDFYKLEAYNSQVMDKQAISTSNIDLVTNKDPESRIHQSSADNRNENTAEEHIISLYSHNESICDQPQSEDFSMTRETDRREDFVVNNTNEGAAINENSIIQSDNIVIDNHHIVSCYELCDDNSVANQEFLPACYSNDNSNTVEALINANGHSSRPCTKVEGQCNEEKCSTHRQNYENISCSNNSPHAGNFNNETESRNANDSYKAGFEAFDMQNEDKQESEEDFAISNKDKKTDEDKQENVRSENSVESFNLSNHPVNIFNAKPRCNSTVILDSFNEEAYNIQDTDFDVIPTENLFNDILISDHQTKPDQTVVLCSVEDQGVQNVFDPGMSSKLTIHKLFSENIFDSNEEEVEMDKPVFRLPENGNNDDHAFLNPGFSMNREEFE